MSTPTLPDRRRFLNVCTAFGLGSTLFPGVLWGMVQEKAQTPGRDAAGQPAPAGAKKPAAPAAVVAPKITKEMISAAAMIAAVEINDEYKDMMVGDLNDQLKSYKAIYDLKIPNSVAPAVAFNPVLPGIKVDAEAAATTAPAVSGAGTRAKAVPVRVSKLKVAVATSNNLEDLALYSVRQLSELVRTRKVTSAALTDMYIARIKRLDPKLHFLITLTEERARAQAKKADAEIAAGKYRGPLHGLPWGAKDLLAVKGYRTTWGAAGFEDQKFDEDATVVKRLDAAGAVLVAKFSLGALAQGDLWFGERTRNPWRPSQGSSGSSAGSSSATSAGCVAFAIGSETLGSISSPSTRCGVTGLRPTFGRVPRTGAMALSWSMDKLGPICRSVEDCAFVLSAIYGPDGEDGSVHNYGFSWNPDLDISKLRIGYLKADFERDIPLPDDDEVDATVKQARDRARKNRIIQKGFDTASLAVLKEKLGIKLIPVELPKLPFGSMVPVLLAEAAAAFDDLTRSGRDKLLTGQTHDDWPNQFRNARFIPAVEYVNANRARTMGMQQVAKIFEKVDLFVAPTGSGQLTMTNLTGHPAIILPNGFRPADAPVSEKITDGGGPGTPVSITFVGNLFGEAKMLAVAKAYQDATEFHLKHPVV
ncbi:MAG: Amidase [Acidobacteriales bacterium]|nr:Amidase [Terriglobales bacterium]